MAQCPLVVGRDFFSSYMHLGLSKGNGNIKQIPDSEHVFAKNKTRTNKKHVTGPPALYLMPTTLHTF